MKPPRIAEYPLLAFFLSRVGIEWLFRIRRFIFRMGSEVMWTGVEPGLGAEGLAVRLNIGIWRESDIVIWGCCAACRSRFYCGPVEREIERTWTQILIDFGVTLSSFRMLSGESVSRACLKEWGEFNWQRQENSPDCCIVEYWQFMFEKNLWFDVRTLLSEMQADHFKLQDYQMPSLFFWSDLDGWIAFERFGTRCAGWH